MANKNNSGNFLDLLLVIFFFVLITYIKVLIISDLLIWFELPIELTRKQLFGAILILGIIVAKYKNKDDNDARTSDEKIKDTIVDGITLTLVLLVVWLLFYIIYSLIFK